MIKYSLIDSYKSSAFYHILLLSPVLFSSPPLSLPLPLSLPPSHSLSLYIIMTLWLLLPNTLMTARNDGKKKVTIIMVKKTVAFEVVRLRQELY